MPSVKPSSKAERPKANDPEREVPVLNPRQLQRHLDALTRGDGATQREAIRQLKQHESREWADVPVKLVRPIVSALQRQLGNGKHDASSGALPGFRQEVATVLGRIGRGAESAVPELSALLAPGTADAVREAAAKALGAMGRAARPAVSDLLGVLTPECRVNLAGNVAWALGEIGCADAQVSAALRNLWSLAIRCETSRFQVATALCKLRIQAPALMETLTGTLAGHAKIAARQAATEALSWCGPDDVGVVPALVVALHDEDEATRQIAEAGLARMRLTKPKAVQICCNQLGECLIAEAALRKSGDLSLAPLMAALRHKNPITREKAAQTLGALREAAAPAAEPLVTALKDKDRGVRLSAAKALWNITKQPDRVVPVLINFLKGDGLPPIDAGELRRTFVQTVIEALCRIGPVANRAIPALKSMMKDNNRLIRESAQRALVVISAA
jgi:HEAT repeat protein